MLFFFLLFDYPHTVKQKTDNHHFFNSFAHLMKIPKKKVVITENDCILFFIETPFISSKRKVQLIGNHNSVIVPFLLNQLFSEKCFFLDYVNL